MSAYSTSYKQTNQKSNYPKAPFTPVNQPPAQNPPQAPASYQQAAQNPSQNPQSQQNQTQRQMFMPQQQVAAVLTHQPPPQPPPSQPQSNQQGQNSAPSRGIPPPPQPQQTQNYQTQNSNTQNQVSQQQQQQQQPNAVYLPQQQFNTDMYQYQARAIPFIPGQAPNPSQNFVFVGNPIYVPNQNHPQAAHYDPSHNPNVQQTHQQPYIQGAQGMFPAPPFIYQGPAPWLQHTMQQQSGQIHRQNLAQPAPQSAQSQAAPAPQPTNQVTPNSQPAQQTDNLSQNVVNNLPHYTNPPIIPPAALPYSAYQAYNPNIIPAAQPQTYQKREKKPLLIVDPNTKKAINENIATTNTTATTTVTDKAAPQPQTTKPEVTSQKVDKKEEKPQEDKKVINNTGSDIQAQVLRSMREQQQNKPEIDTEKKTTETPENVNINKPGHKQVTVSVAQAQAPVVIQPNSYSAVINKKPEIKSVKSDDNNNKKVEDLPEKIKELSVESVEEEKVVVATVAPVVVEPVEVKEPTVVTVVEPEQKDGKRRYDREFLLNLQNSKLSSQIPDHLRDCEIFQELRAQKQSQYFGKASFGGASQDGQQYGKGSMSKQKPGQKSYGPGKYNKGSTEVQITLSSDKDAPLKRVENPYQIRKPSTEHEELIREVRNILNKLTPQNIQKLTGDLINLPINTEDRLKDSIHVIFEKSLDEQVFSQTYGELCRILAQIRVPLNTDPTKFINFRTMLLTKCQKEFDSDYAQNINYEKLLVEAEAQTDETKRTELKEIAEDKLRKAKRRSLGNIRFIGELFKLKMLTEGIMNDCIERLLKQDTDEENLECLCKLLTTIGRELDKPANAHRMKSYFEKLERIAKKKDNNISARIRFMIMDVIDLRKNNWVPRRKDAGPKKIDEIRREAEEEQARVDAEIARQQLLDKRHPGQKGGKYSQHLPKSTSMDSDTFHARSAKTQNGSMVNKIKDVKQITMNKNMNGEVTLGPGGGSGYGWNKPKPVQETTIPQSASFSAQKRVAEPVARLSMDSKSVKPDRVQAVKRMDSGDYSKSDSSQASSRESSLTRVSKKKYTEDEVERKASNLVNELAEHKNLDESLKDLEEFTPSDPQQYSEFVEQLIMATLEKTETMRTLLGQFLYTALKDKKLDSDRFELGLKRVIELSDDMSIDIPKISSYLSQIIAQLFNENFSIEFLKSALEPIKEMTLGADIISECLNRASDRLGQSTTSEIFKASNLQLNEFLHGVEDSNAFITEHKLQWVNKERSLSVETYENKLNQIIVPTVENKVIFDKIESEFGPDEIRSKGFIRALVISVCVSCYNNNKFDDLLFKTRTPILNKFIDQKEDLELESLFAIQALDHRMKHQPGFIRIIFDLFYDEDIIREEVFWKWRTEDKEEGHGISVLSLKTFFDWLSEAEADQAES